MISCQRRLDLVGKEKIGPHYVYKLYTGSTGVLDICQAQTRKLATTIYHGCCSQHLRSQQTKMLNPEVTWLVLRSHKKRYVGMLLLLLYNNSCIAKAGLLEGP
eukprot:scaffold104882_cov51-Prasinocladus_malaysianus.AAC.2